mmetsp:Transcript_22808/g.47309  ORF Transcript_22808/g.47309 Transcript_22808/m.47309 type:complete len:255 (-) Transcript_22808:12-776(-)
MQTAYKLYYWPARGRAEQIRLCMADAGIEFEDVNWGLDNISDQKLKSDFFARCRELGGNLTTNVPMLEVEDGKFYTQSTAIIRYIGRKTGAYSGTVEEDVLIATVDDFRTANYKGMRVFGASPSAVDDYITTILPKHLDNFTRLLNNNSGFYLLGSKATIADFSLYDALHVAERQVPGILEKYQRVKLFFDTVGARPGIKKWVESEQRTKLWAFPSVLVKEEETKKGASSRKLAIAVTTMVGLATILHMRRRRS